MHTHMLRHTHSQSRELLLQGWTGHREIFPGGPINNGLIDGRFIYLFIYLLAVPRCFYVDAVKKERDWRKNKTELRRLSEEDSDRARLEINMWGWVISKRACHERVSRKMIRAMVKQRYPTVRSLL